MRITKKALSQDCGIDIKTAHNVLDLLNGKLSPHGFKSVQAWTAQCYHDPRNIEKVMCALNELLGGHGVEAIRGKHVDFYHGDCVASYVNMGDSYDGTIVRDHVKQCYRLTSWGDFVEKFEKRYGIT